MNDLQNSLLLIGGALILGMLAYNYFQGSRAKRQGALPRNMIEHDPLFQQDPRTEPTAEFNAVVQQAFFDHGKEVGLDQALDVEMTGQIFCQVYVNFDTPVQASQVVQSLKELSHAGDKPVYVHLLLAGEEESQWLSFDPAYSAIATLRFSVLLANRKGVLTAIAYSEFLNKVQMLSDTLGAHLEFPEMDHVVAKAESLDKLGVALDTLLGLHCVLPGQVETGVVERILKEDAWYQEGRHWAKGEHHKRMATVIVHELPEKKVLSFSLDLPNCHDPINALHLIADLAQRIASEHQGSVMDDAGRPLTSNAFNLIHNQMVERATHMHEKGFSPGSLAAKLLFS
jgi:ZipA, C-terminal FtsZ-binding domain